MISSNVTSTAFEKGIDPLFRFLTPEQAAQIAGYRADESFQQRIEELATKANEGALASEERAEYEGYVRANKFVAIFQAQARHHLNGQ